MTRRFPPPLFGVERTERRSETFVSLAVESDGECSKTEFVNLARERLRKPDDGERYSREYLQRIISTYIQLGVLRQESNDQITVWQFGRDWLADEIDFETFLWYAIKRAWVLEGKFPEGIDGLRTIHRLLANTENPLARGEIRETLATEQDYEYNEQGIRGFPTLLVELGAAEQTAEGYVATDPVSRWRSRFRNVDLLPAFERWLKQEGAHVDPPPERVKRDLAKYYIYRESGGHGKHRQLYDTFRRDYLKSAAYENDVSEPRIRRADKYVEVENERQRLRDQIRKQFPSITSDALAGLSTDVLARMVEAETESAAQRVLSEGGAGLSRADLEQWSNSSSNSYSFPSEFTLYDWQREAADEWIEPPTSESCSRQPETGIARVVTGAGKTVMALEVIRRWLENHPDGVVTILVPTNVLMRQWLEELIAKLNVPTEDIGWAGGGNKDRFEDGHRILVSIVNSAVKDDFLNDTLNAHGTTEHLLIADECHRYTGETFSNIFKYQRTASLGLSATPLSDPGDENEEHSDTDQLLLNELGEVYYELTYDEAIERNLIPEFKVFYVGFDLTDAERDTYERFTDAIVDALSEIDTRYGNRLYDLDGNFSQNLQTIADSVDGATPAIADFFQYTQQRRDLIADAIGRQAITLSLLQQTIDDSQKSIVFQERISQLERMVAPAETRGRNARTGDITDDHGGRRRLYSQYPGLETVDQDLENLFFDADYKPVMYHSGHRNSAWNDFAIEWFADDGFANVMLSVKALVEGVDVPSADVGIIRVSSGSVRQRIQTLGRVLRTGEDPTTPSELYVLYARDTVDEKIFHDYDWDDQLSMADVTHLKWDPDGDWTTGDWDETLSFWECVREATDEERPSPPDTRPVPDAKTLSRGDPYIGPWGDYRFSVDYTGTPFEKGQNGRCEISNDKAEEIAKFVADEKGGGTIRVNDANHALMVEDNEAVFLGVVDPDEFEFTDPDSITDDPDTDALDGLVE